MTAMETDDMWADTPAGHFAELMAWLQAHGFRRSTLGTDLRCYVSGRVKVFATPGRSTTVMVMNGDTPVPAWTVRVDPDAPFDVVCAAITSARVTA